MPVLNEGQHAGEFVLSEANGHRSRENVTIVSGAGALAAGTVLGKITASSKYEPSAATGATGSEVGSAILIQNVDATSADVEAAVIFRDAEVNKHQLVYDSTVDDQAKTDTKNAELSAAGIVAR